MKTFLKRKFFLQFLFLKGITVDMFCKHASMSPSTFDHIARGRAMSFKSEHSIAKGLAIIDRTMSIEIFLNRIDTDTEKTRPALPINKESCLLGMSKPPLMLYPELKKCLEKRIDAHCLCHVLTTISDICYDKAEESRIHNDDFERGSEWDNIGDMLEEITHCPNH